MLRIPLQSDVGWRCGAASRTRSSCNVVRQAAALLPSQRRVVDTTKLASQPHARLGQTTSATTSDRSCSNLTDRDVHRRQRRRGCRGRDPPFPQYPDKCFIFFPLAELLNTASRCHFHLQCALCTVNYWFIYWFFATCSAIDTNSYQ